MLAAGLTEGEVRLYLPWLHLRGLQLSYDGNTLPCPYLTLPVHLPRQVQMARLVATSLWGNLADL